MADPRRAAGRRPGGRPGGRPPTPRKAVDPARLAAFDVLRAVRVDEAYANLVLPEMLRKHGLSGRDAGFATELASGAIRRQGTYDAIIAACLDRSLAKVEAKVLDVLRLGAHQLLAMRVPDHAAISTSVDLARARVGQGPAGFVNAVLRKVARNDLATWVRTVAPDVATDPIGFASIAHSHPRWVVSALADALAADDRAGDQGDELDDLLAADNAPPAVTLVARPGRVTREELIVQSSGEPTELSPYGVVSPGGDPATFPAVASGAAGVQDEGSQLVALALADAPLDDADARWLDLCAGPGGKAALLAALAAERGARLVANEAAPHRTELVRRALTAADGGFVAGVEAVVTGDGTRPRGEAGWESASFDRILVDAPCSGLGALRRRPEARWRKTPADLRELVELQKGLLTAALDLVRPGGVVVYATCSPVPAETSGIVDAVLADRGDVERAESWQLWPHVHHTDAMFAALLRRLS